MKYNDKKTRNIISSHQNKSDDYDNNYYNRNTRAEKRRLNREINNFRIRLSQNNKYWFDSLNIDEKMYVTKQCDEYNPIVDLKKKYPGSLSYQRDMKLNDIIS